MSYNMHELPKYLSTAGKITVVTSLVGVMLFTLIFLLNIGAKELKHAEAQSGLATTSITVLNTPPSWDVPAEEEVGSSTSTPTNSGSEVAWVGTGTDSNAAPYFLIICSTNSASATLNTLGVGTAPPTCNGGTQWAVSASTTSGTEARAATTTLEAWAESNVWYAFICDDDAVNARCNATSYQGTGTTSSPFNVNHRPDFTLFSDDSPKLPSETVTFSGTSTDPDVVDAADTMKLFVCSTASFSATSSSCNALTLATSTFGTGVLTATYDIPGVRRDADYAAYGYVIDEHGHASLGVAQGTDAVLTVANATPYVLSANIDLNNSSDIVLTQFEAETTGFPLQFTVSDNNSCLNASSTDEVVDWEISVFRSTVGSSSCAAIGDYDANNCYTNTVPTTTWNIACTASSTSCTGSSDPDMIVDCTFPLWYIADPTFGAATDTPHYATGWSAAVAPIDDDFATGTFATSTDARELYGLLGIALDTLAIPYGSLEPGNETGPTLANASTTIRAIGNVAVDELLSGHAMCGTYTSAVTCPNSASSTIPESYQVFATSSAATYAQASSSGNKLSSTTLTELEVNVLKSTSTVTQASAKTYWGIHVPISITLAGNYTGENTFYGKVAEVADWY